MKKQINLLYILSTVLGISTFAAGTVVAGYGNGSTQISNTEQTVPYNPKDGSLFPGGKCKNCTKDGSLFPGTPCKSCTKDGSLFPGPCKKCEQRKIEHAKVKNYIPYTPVVYNAMQANCCQMAPITLAHVDFRIAKGGNDVYSNKLGNYRFRIFGCRRYDKEAMLNKGRIMEKDIAFNQVFEESVGDCYKVLPMPKDLCLQDSNIEMPEYVLTAEITDYFMNICDEYDWDKVQKNDARNGSSEITITWRLMDLTMNTVYWKGETTGYGELQEGEKNGEVKLIERAFADATGNLRLRDDFEGNLMKRLSPEQLSAQKMAIIEEETLLDPVKCGYRQEYTAIKNCEVGRPGVDITQCQPVCPCQNVCGQGGVTGDGCCNEVIEIVEDGGVIDAGTIVDNDITENGDVTSTFDIINSCIDENGNVKTDGLCHVVDDTWIDTGDVKALDKFCVVSTDPCKILTPETVYRMRSSVVQIESPNGRKGAGLLISDKFILTSGDLVDKKTNSYKVKTVRNDELVARAVRVNPSKNTALLMLDKSTNYTPLALNLSLPEVGKNGFLTLGLLDVKDFTNGEDYLENSASIEGYRYSQEKGSEILANTFIQNVTVGGGLFYKDCTVTGMAHSGVKTSDGLDIYVPTETALRSLGITICGHEYVEESPWQQTVYKPVSKQIKKVQKAPEVMKAKDRK